MIKTLKRRSVVSCAMAYGVKILSMARFAARLSSRASRTRASPLPRRLNALMTGIPSICSRTASTSFACAFCRFGARLRDFFSTEEVTSK